MRPPLLAQVVAVFSRRTPAFQPSPGQSRTFGGALRQVLHARPAAPAKPAKPASVDGIALAQLAEEFATRPARERLANRAWLESPETELVHQLLYTRGEANALASALAGAHILALALASALASALDRARARASDLARDLASDRDQARARARDLASASDQARVRTSFLARTIASTHALASDLDPDSASAIASELASASAIARVIASDLDSARASASAIASNLDSARASAIASARDQVLTIASNLDSAHASAIARAIASNLDSASAIASARISAVLYDPSLPEAIFDAIRNARMAGGATEAEWITVIATLTRLRAAARDMVGADLRTTDLGDIPLDGVQWSASTTWPDTFREWVRTHSMQIGPDLYQIQDRFDSNDRTETLVG
jgi:hypothetical protein